MNATITIDKNRVIGQIDPRIYGSFVEHLGRCVYGGVYEPEHPQADEDGFRADVLDLVKDLNVPIVRYPGGNFVSNYRWEDGVGPVTQRPKRLDAAWRTTEPNAFGTNEFMNWCKKAGTSPMMAVNLGTRGIEAAMDLLEYCNHPSGSTLSDLRIVHGSPEPHNVRVWCLGNEMDGPWQVGHKTADEYGRLAFEVGKAMKKYDPTLELVSCGSSASYMPTYPEWERQTLMHTYEIADYVSLHQYFSNADEDSASFLASSLDTDQFIRTVISVCDYVKACKKGDKDIKISFDEWNCWYHNSRADNEIMDQTPWGIAPPLLEDVFTMEDAVVAGNTLITFLKHADRVKIACQAQLVNVIAPIMTKNGGPAWRQTIYYPMQLTSRYGRGLSLEADVRCAKYDCKRFTDVPYLDAAATWDEAENALCLFVVNRSLTEDAALSLRLEDFADCVPLEHLELWNPDLKAANTSDAPDSVCPVRREAMVQDDGLLKTSLKPCSWNLLRFRVK